MRKHDGGFSAQELKGVLQQYAMGRIQRVEALTAGNRASAKLLIHTDQGDFFLKRRPRGRDDALHVEFTHALQDHLAGCGYPVAGLVSSSQNGSTAVYAFGRAYELFHYVEGRRCDGSPREVAEAGRQLALFHRHVRSFRWRWMPTRQTYHDAGSVRGNLRVIRSETGPGPSRQGPSDPRLQRTADELLVHYNQSSTAVNSLGFDDWPVQVVHADWHPGNLLFAGGRAVCVVDFDTVKVAPPVTDLANGVLQFSIVGVRPNPADWPAYLDQAKMAYFLEGYFEVETLPGVMLEALCDLMIEIMIAEAVVPIAATGYFGHHSGLKFLQMIHRKCDWIDENRQTLMDVVRHAM